WTTNIPTYGRVRYRGIYEGIDLVFYGNQRRLEYDVVVEPGADPGVVRFSYEGVEELRVNDRGELVAVLPSGKELVQRKPHVYQEVNGKKEIIGGEYVVSREGNSFVYSFRVSSYDRRYALFIDPVLSYSTYLGSFSNDYGYDIAVDSNGSAYVVGTTQSPDFPTQNPFQTDANSYDAVVIKLSSQGSSLVYSTYLGGNGRDDGLGIAVDGNGSAYVVGKTRSTDFPTTSNAYDKTCGTDGNCNDNNSSKNDAFVTKFSPQGDSLLYSTYLGGSDVEGNDGWEEYGFGIAVDSDGKAYVVGYTHSPDFPLKNEYAPSQGAGSEVFITKLDTNQSGSNSLLYSTYLGRGYGFDIALGSNGVVYITGRRSRGAPWGVDAIVAQVDTLKSGNASLLHFTYIGGTGNDSGTAIEVDSNGYVYLTGYTYSDDLPVTPSAYDSTCGSDGNCNSGKEDAFIAKLDVQQDKTLYLSYFGGEREDRPLGIAVDTNGVVFIAGYTRSTDFPTTQDAYDSTCGGDGSCDTNQNRYDAFVAKFDTTRSGGDSLLYSTYFGGSESDYGQGIALDSLGNVYITGYTRSDDFPLQKPVQTTIEGVEDVFIAKFSEYATLTVTTSGSGSGSITSTPAGIDCGSDCSEIYTLNSDVTLTVAPDASSTFSGWSNDCSSCGTSTSCVVTMSTDKTCTAAFTSSTGGNGGGGCSTNGAPMNALAWVLPFLFILIRRFVRVT
ncbi:SBBP repeat-containing protein, partial [Hydrogenivirga sp.]